MLDKAVTMASNFLTTELVKTCKNFSRTKKARIDVEQLNLIYKYNSYVGGGAGLINRMGTNRTSDPALEEKSGTEYS